MNTIVERRPSARWASAISASVPPSPLLSARMTKITYLIVTTMISAQKIRETTPSTAMSLGPPRMWLSAARMA